MIRIDSGVIKIVLCVVTKIFLIIIRPILVKAPTFLMVCMSKQPTAYSPLFNWCKDSVRHSGLDSLCSLLWGFYQGFYTCICINSLIFVFTIFRIRALLIVPKVWHFICWRLFLNWAIMSTDKLNISQTVLIPIICLGVGYCNYDRCHKN